MHTHADRRPYENIPRAPIREIKRNLLAHDVVLSEEEDEDMSPQAAHRIWPPTSESKFVERRGRNYLKINPTQFDFGGTDETLTSTKNPNTRYYNGGSTIQTQAINTNEGTPLSQLRKIQQPKILEESQKPLHMSRNFLRYTEKDFESYVEYLKDNTNDFFDTQFVHRLEHKTRILRRIVNLQAAQAIAAVERQVESDGEQTQDSVAQKQRHKVIKEQRKTLAAYNQKLDMI